MLETFLVPEKTVATAKGDGPSTDLSHARYRVFLLTLEVEDVVEQESLDVSVLGSVDGATWQPKPLASFPQTFYRGESPMLLDLKEQADVKYVRAHWEVNRWGRGSETPRFEFSVTLKEVAPEILRDAEAQARSLA
jgi:hypothetical protein